MNMGVVVAQGEREGTGETEVVMVEAAGGRVGGEGRERGVERG